LFIITEINWILKINYFEISVICKLFILILTMNINSLAIAQTDVSTESVPDGYYEF
jgi:hypothetical protein